MIKLQVRGIKESKSIEFYQIRDKLIYRTYLSSMGRNKFSQREIEIIGKLLRRKMAGTRFQQKMVRHTLALHLSSTSLTSTFKARPSDPKTWMNVCVVGAYRFWTMPLSMP